MTAKTYGSMDIFKLLPKTNCKECRAPSCLAFSVLAAKGEKELEECPYLDDNALARFGGERKKPKSVQENLEASVARLKEKLAAIDFSEASRRIGGNVSNGKLSFKIYGKDFAVDKTGVFSSDIHVYPVAVPVLHYILYSRGLPPSGKWAPLRELPGGKNWQRLFHQRCEKPLKQIADSYTDLFEDMIRLFNGKTVENLFESDISLVLHPFPKVPLLICYWKPDEGMASDLNLFFDQNAEENLKIESLYTVGTGLVTMLERFAAKHTQ